MYLGKQAVQGNCEKKGHLSVLLTTYQQRVEITKELFKERQGSPLMCAEQSMHDIRHLNTKQNETISTSSVRI